MGAQHTLIRQREEIAELNQTNGKLESTLRSVYKLLGLEPYRNEPSNIFEEITRLQSYRREHEGTINPVLHTLQEENAKLWYLLRSVLNDETLVKEPPYEQYDPMRQQPKRPFQPPTF